MTTPSPMKLGAFAGQTRPLVRFACIPCTAVAPVPCDRQGCFCLRWLHKPGVLSYVSEGAWGSVPSDNILNRPPSIPWNTRVSLSVAYGVSRRHALCVCVGGSRLLIDNACCTAEALFDAPALTVALARRHVRASYYRYTCSCRPRLGMAGQGTAPGWLQSVWQCNDGRGPVLLGGQGKQCPTHTGYVPLLGSLPFWVLLLGAPFLSPPGVVGKPRHVQWHAWFIWFHIACKQTRFGLIEVYCAGPMGQTGTRMHAAMAPSKGKATKKAVHTVMLEVVPPNAPNLFGMFRACRVEGGRRSFLPYHPSHRGSTLCDDEHVANEE